MRNRLKLVPFYKSPYLCMYPIITCQVESCVSEILEQPPKSLSGKKQMYRCKRKREKKKQTNKRKKRGTGSDGKRQQEGYVIHPTVIDKLYGTNQHSCLDLVCARAYVCVCPQFLDSRPLIASF